MIQIIEKKVNTISIFTNQGISPFPLFNEHFFPILVEEKFESHLIIAMM